MAFTVKGAIIDNTGRKNIEENYNSIEEALKKYPIDQLANIMGINYNPLTSDLKSFEDANKGSYMLFKGIDKPYQNSYFQLYNYIKSNMKTIKDSYEQEKNRQEAYNRTQAEVDRINKQDRKLDNTIPVNNTVDEKKKSDDAVILQNIIDTVNKAVSEDIDESSLNAILLNKYNIKPLLYENKLDPNTKTIRRMVKLNTPDALNNSPVTWIPVDKYKPVPPVGEKDPDPIPDPRVKEGSKVNPNLATFSLTPQEKAYLLQKLPERKMPTSYWDAANTGSAGMGFGLGDFLVNAAYQAKNRADLENIYGKISTGGTYKRELTPQDMAQIQLAQSKIDSVEATAMLNKVKAMNLDRNYDIITPDGRKMKYGRYLDELALQKQQAEIGDEWASVNQRNAYANAAGNGFLAVDPVTMREKVDTVVGDKIKSTQKQILDKNKK